MKKPRICFIAHNGYGAISNLPTGHIGGIERQMAFMSRWLAEKGFDVSLLTWDEGHPDAEPIDGVKIFNICREDGGLIGLRFFHPRWSGLICAMQRADADIYYQNCGEYVTGQVAMWCRSSKRKFVYSVASDPDVDPRLSAMKNFHDRFFYRYGIRRADRILTQTAYQSDCLRRFWNLDSTVIPMPSLLGTDDRYISATPPNGQDVHVLWVGRIDEPKRLEWLLEIAEACPNLQFDVIGKAHDRTDYVRELEQKARSLRNVKMHGFVCHLNLSECYSEASILCCTSRHEGFPNTFLEAWSHGLPVVSTVDPDRVIETHGLGGVARDVPGLTEKIYKLAESPDRWKQASDNARGYFLKKHDYKVVMPLYEKIFLEVAQEK